MIEVRDLAKTYTLATGDTLRAVEGVSFSISGAERVGVVGESGSGKTTLGRLLLRLVPPTRGAVLYDGTDVARLTGERMRAFRRETAIVFQDPYSSLDPRMTVAAIVAEPLVTHTALRGRALREQVEALLATVGLSGSDRVRFPHHFSGGGRQRVAIARALASHPRFIVFDEPTSALDVSVQAQILNLIAELQRSEGLGYLFISHNLAVVERMADRILVMYLGKIMETGSPADILSRPLHPYTKALVAAAPVPDPRTRRRYAPIEGEPPSPLHPPDGCPFSTRCPVRIDVCGHVEPPLLRVAGGERREIACHLVEG